MNSGFYAACSALLARSDALDVAANNLSNVNTTGFRSQAELFRSMVSPDSTANSLNRAINDYGVLGGTFINMNSGHLEPTGNSLDLGIEGAGFFVAQTKAGIRYTRNGNFHVDTNGTLLTAEGDPVLGDRNLKLQLPSGPVSVSSDGTISVAGTLVGKLRLVELDPSSMTAEGNSYFQAAPEKVTDATATRVRQGMLESSNVEPVSASIGLLALQRHADLLERTLHVFYSDFDRTAVDQLARGQ